nr:ATP synthase F0 subunit 8 [Gibbosula laosensis]
MPQLSPMSWVFVFGVFLVFFIWLMVVVWWGNSGGYSVYSSEIDSGFAGVCNGLQWGFSKGGLGKLGGNNDSN